MLIIPRPQSLEIFDNFLQVEIEKISLDSFSEVIKQEADVLFHKQLIEKNFNNLKDKKTGFIVFNKVDMDNEAYTINITTNNILINASTDVGAYYALKSLKQIIATSKIPCLSISDYPLLKTRGFMLDISRNKVPTIDTIKQIINLLSDLKYNHLELYIEGFSFEYKKYASIIPHKNHITQNDYIEIEAYAKNHFIDLVPNQNGFGHMGDWLSLPSFSHLAECPNGFDIWGSHRDSTTLDVTNPESTALVQSLYDELLPISSSKYFNMNFDEPYELGYGNSKTLCEKTSKEDCFINFFTPLARYVEAYNKTPMLWGDFLIHHIDAINKLPPNIIFIDWGYHKNYDFNQHAKMLQQIGIHYLLAPGTNTWSCLTGRYDDMYATIYNSCNATKNYGGDGIILTDWGDMGHLQYWPFSYLGLIYGASYSWNDISEDEVIQYMNYLTNDNALSEALIRLSTYTRLEGEYRDYGSRLFSSIMWAELICNEHHGLTEYLNKIKSNLITMDNVLILDQFFQEIKELISTSDHHNLIYREIDNTVYLLETLLETNKLYSSVILNEKIIIKDIDNIINRLQEYISIHKALWLERNIIDGFTFSIEKINKLIYMLSLLKEREEKA